MPLTMDFTAAERERMGVVVNNLGIYAAQVMLQTAPEFSQQALANLARARQKDDALLKRLDEAAREQGDESPLRLIEDLARMPIDIGKAMTLVRRCLLASAFLGHCLAQPAHLAQRQVAVDALETEKRLH